MHTLNYAAITVAFPIIAGANMFLVQGLKKVMERRVKPTDPDHDFLVQLLTFGTAAALGVFAMVLIGPAVNTWRDWVTVLGVCGAYGVGGGALSMAAYKFANSGLPQTPPVTTPAALAAAYGRYQQPRGQRIVKTPEQTTEVKTDKSP